MAARLISRSEVTAVEKAREELLNGITQHTQIILDMKHHLNSLAPTAVLPPELLAEVFLYLAHESLSISRPDAKCGRYPVGQLLYPYRWMAVTHVCHHWRAVALRAPQLWSVIWIVGAECVAEMLLRSRSTPLVVRANHLQGRGPALDLVLQELPRIVSFDVRMPPHLQLRDWPVDAPRLKELVLQSEDTYDMLTLSTTLLQTHFSKCDIPVLERLDLHSVQVQWSNSLLKPTLKHLTLRGTRSPTSLTMADVMLVLEKLPLLETLDLDGCLPLPGASDRENVLRVVELPRLQSLRLLSSAITCARFLKCVSFGAYVTMAFNVQLLQPTDTNELFPMLLRKLSQQHEGGDGRRCSPILRSLSVRSILGGTALQFKGWPTYHDIKQLYEKSNDTLPEPFFDLTLRHNEHVPVLHLLRAVPTGDVESVLLNPLYCSHNSEKLEWTRAFEGLPKVRELGLGPWAKEHVHQVLSHRVPVNEAASSGAGAVKKTRMRRDVCMPRLTLLYLYGICLVPGRDTFLKRLSSALERRKKAKHPVEMLSIQDSLRLSEEDAMSFKTVVSKVEWSPRQRMNVFVEEDDDDWTDSMEGDEEDYPIFPHFGAMDPWLGFPEFADDFTDEDDGEAFMW